MSSQWDLFFLLAVVCWINCASAASVLPLVESSLNSSGSTPALCCHFEKGTCGFTWGLGVTQWWQWSGDGSGRHPSTSLFPLFAHNSNYMWSQNDDGAISMSPMIEDFEERTEFGFNYYAHIEDTSGSSALYVYFQVYNNPTLVVLDILGDTGEAWIHRTVDCIGKSCCLSYPCKGYIKIGSRISSKNALYAFDDIEASNGCSVAPTTHTTQSTTTTAIATSAAPLNPGCCEFSTNSCGFSNSDPSQQGSWIWSGNGYSPDSSLFPQFPQDGNYLFTQNADNAITDSSLYNVSANTVFGVSYYAHIEDTSGSSSLVVYFINSDGSPNTVLAVLGDTDETFKYISLACSTKSCCLSYPCNGRVRFVGRALSKNELYAIDKVEVNGACS